jgi:hypothetical protein
MPDIKPLFWHRCRGLKKKKKLPHQLGTSGDDPDEVQRDGDDDGNNLPSPGRNFSDRFLPARELFSLGVFRPAEAAVSISDPP